MDRPIIMTGESVCAILAGRKTQTRRLMSLPRAPDHLGRWEASTSGGPGLRDSKGREYPPFPVVWHTRTGQSFASPYSIGDRLWCKESWDYVGGTEYLYQQEPGAVLYRERDQNLSGHLQRKWRTPLFMPRWASRLTLEVTEVRIQRLQEISEEDAIAEGVRHWPDIADPHPYKHGPRWSMATPTSTDQCLGTARYAYASAWDAIQGSRPSWKAVLWASNPWVSAITFRLVA